MTHITKFVKQILPYSIFSFIKAIYVYYKRRRIRSEFRRMYLLDLNRYLKYSRTFGNDSEEKMIGAICLLYHVIEKGLTMPETRLGFGTQRVMDLCQACLDYMSVYGQNDEQLNHAIGVVLEYEDYHVKNNYKLDKETEHHINELKRKLMTYVNKTSQIQSNRSDYFKYVESSFLEFSKSRSSIRHFSSAEIPLSKIQNALELARKTPSACNRQSWRTYIYSNKQMICRLLDAQGGNKGFGQLADKLIVITGELGGFCYTNERNQVYIDGGMYAMNILYALHYNQVATCILNCSFDFDKEKSIKDLGGIKDSEVLIAMIACGDAANEFKIALSHRYDFQRTNTFKD